MMKCLIILLCGICLAAANNNRAIKLFTDATNVFSQNVYKEISATSHGNFYVSPLSAELLLVAIEAGAKGRTDKEIYKLLHIHGVHYFMKRVLNNVLPNFKKTLFTANKLYVKKSYALNRNFTTSNFPVNQLEVEKINFSNNEQAADTINLFVKKGTNNRISKFIKPKELNKHTQSVLINAVYFKADWDVIFHRYHVEKGNWYTTATHAVEIDHLQKLEYVNYYKSRELKAQFLEIPFRGRKDSLVIVLPNDKDGLSSLENNLDQVFNLQNKTKLVYAKVRLPKFKFTSVIDFKPILTKVGVKKLFDKDEADLTGISTGKGHLVIDEFKQRTRIWAGMNGLENNLYIKVNRDDSYLIPKEKIVVDFVADHPFLFYIKRENLIVFVGRVTDPRKH